MKAQADYWTYKAPPTPKHADVVSACVQWHFRTMGTTIARHATVRYSGEQGERRQTSAAPMPAQNKVVPEKAP